MGNNTYKCSVCRHELFKEESLESCIQYGVKVVNGTKNYDNAGRIQIEENNKNTTWRLYCEQCGEEYTGNIINE